MRLLRRYALRNDSTQIYDRGLFGAGQAWIPAFAGMTHGEVHLLRWPDPSTPLRSGRDDKRARGQFNLLFAIYY